MNIAFSSWFVEIEMFAREEVSLGPFLSRGGALYAAQEYVSKHITKMYQKEILRDLEELGYHESDDLLIGLRQRYRLTDL